MHLKKYLKTLLLMLFMYAMTWYLVVLLTQQRIQRQGYAQLKNIELQQSPFKWEFDDFSSDIVAPYLKDWQQLKPGQILALKGSNPQLSLNLSGELINTLQHESLVFRSSAGLTGHVSIQVQVDLEDGRYHNLFKLRLFGTQQKIDLTQVWEQLQQSETVFNWGQPPYRISSIVMQFINPKADVLIDAVELPYSSAIKSIESINIDCKKGVESLPQSGDLTVFHLKQRCLFPSTYMWIKSRIQNQFPGSVLLLSDLTLWSEVDAHRINQGDRGWFYSLVLYAWILIFMGLIYLTVRAHDKDKVTLQGIKVNRPMVSGKRAYAIILGAGSLVFIFLSAIQQPTFSVFKLWPMYFIWALFQQLILGKVLAEKIFYQRTGNRILASLLAAVIFSLLHVPSVTLMIATFVSGFVWSYAWLLYKKIIPLALTHALLALQFYAVMPEKFLYSARIFHWFWQ